MRLHRVEIANHSRIHDLDLELRRHAVIVGANDVGKSSILRMLHLLLGTSTAGLYQALKPNDLRDHEQPLVVNASCSRPESHNDLTTTGGSPHNPNSPSVPMTGSLCSRRRCWRFAL